MKCAGSLSHEALVEIVRVALNGLYRTEREPGNCEAGSHYTPDKEWQIETLDDISSVLNKHGLSPKFVGDTPTCCDTCKGNH